jgi:hypothetical protein
MTGQTSDMAASIAMNLAAAPKAHHKADGKWHLTHSVAIGLPA